MGGSDGYPHFFDGEVDDSCGADASEFGPQVPARQQSRHAREQEAVQAVAGGVYDKIHPVSTRGAIALECEDHGGQHARICPIWGLTSRTRPNPPILPNICFYHGRNKNNTEMNIKLKILGGSLSMIVPKMSYFIGSTQTTLSWFILAGKTCNRFRIWECQKANTIVFPRWSIWCTEAKHISQNMMPLSETSNETKSSS